MGKFMHVSLYIYTILYIHNMHTYVLIFDLGLSPV